MYAVPNIVVGTEYINKQNKYPCLYGACSTAMPLHGEFFKAQPSKWGHGGENRADA